MTIESDRTGSGGNVVAALASFFVPGLGQLVQARLLPALGFFVLAIVWWAICVEVAFSGYL